MLIVGEVESARGKLRAADRTGPAARLAIAAEANTLSMAEKNEDFQISFRAPFVEESNQ